MKLGVKLSVLFFLSHIEMLFYVDGSLKRYVIFCMFSDINSYISVVFYFKQRQTSAGVFFGR